MTDNSEESQLVYICEQLQLCMLPALKEDLDEVQLLPEHFQNYNSVLRQELPKLYDVLQQIENIILQDAAQLKLRTQLVLLLCELTATPTVYKLSADAEAELDNANRLLQKVSVGCHSAEATHIFSYYKQHLQGNCWKRQLGATHGYVRYLEYCCTGDARFPAKLITFSLAVGLNFRECYQLEYKQLGVRIFQMLLQHGTVDDIQKLNIHSVIFEHVFKDTHCMDSLEATIATWSCLFLCLDHFTELNSFTWNQSDDMLERLIQNVNLAPNAETSIHLIGFITKLCYHFTLNLNEIQVAFASEHNEPNNISDHLEICASLTACTSYRWAKDILQMFLLQSDKLFQSAKVCTRMLTEMQRCYLVCILPVPLEALHIHLPEFYTKFVAILLESHVVHEKAPDIIKLTETFIEIFQYQLKNYSQQQQPLGNVNEFARAFKSLQKIVAK